MRSEAIVRLLPSAYQHAAEPGTVLAALLDVMEGMHEPDEALLASVDDLFSPYRTTDALVPFLAGWVGIDPALAAPGVVPIGRLRNLVAVGSLLAKWRGTPMGLQACCEIATGVEGFAIDEPADRSFHFVVRVPAAAIDQLDLIRRIVDIEKPAATTYDLDTESVERDERTVVRR